MNWVTCLGLDSMRVGCLGGISVLGLGYFSTDWVTHLVGAGIKKVNFSNWFDTFLRAVSLIRGPPILCTCWARLFDFN